MPLAKLFGNKRKDRSETTVNSISAPFNLPQDDDHFSQFGPMSSRAKSPSDILDFSGYPRLEPSYSNKNYTTQQPKAKQPTLLSQPIKAGSPSPPLAMPKPKHAVPPAKQVLMGEERDKTEIEGEGKPVYETSTHLPPGRNSASSGGYMGEREDSSEVDDSPDNVPAPPQRQLPRDETEDPRPNPSAPWPQPPRAPRSTEEGKGFFASKKPLLSTHAEPPHTPPMLAPLSVVSVKNIAQELRPALQQPLPLVHEEDEKAPYEPSKNSKGKNTYLDCYLMHENEVLINVPVAATTVEDGSPPTPDSPVIATVVRDESVPISAPFSEMNQSNNTREFSSTPHSYSELADLRQQMSAIKLEREEWKQRENEHRQREQEMLDQINRTQEQLQIALSNGGFLAGGNDLLPNTPGEEVEVLSASKPNQLGPASEDGSVSDDRDFYSLPPSRTRRERQELSDYGEDLSEYSGEEPVHEHRRRRYSYYPIEVDDDYYYDIAPSRRSRHYESKPRLYEHESDRRRRHHSYTPSSVESDLSADLSPRFSGRYSSRHDECNCYDCMADRDRDAYSEEEIPEFIAPRSRSRASSHRSLSRSGSLSRNASRSGSRNRSRSASRNESRSASRSASRSQSRNEPSTPSHSSSHNLSRRSSSRRHSHHAPEEYYDQDVYVPYTKHKKNRRTRSSGSMRTPFRGFPPGDMAYEDWPPEMHEQYIPMPEPQFPVHPPPFHNMHPGMASHMSLPDLGREPQPSTGVPPPQPPASVGAGAATGPPPPRQHPAANEGPKEGPRGILRKPSGTLPNMQQRPPPQAQHPPFPMQHFGPPPPHMMGPHGPFPPHGMPPHPHMGFPPPPHHMFPQGGPPWHGGQHPPMQGPVPPGNTRQSRKS